MQSGIDSSRLRIAAETPMPTRQDVAETEASPTQTAAQAARPVTMTAAQAAREATRPTQTAAAASGSSKSLFGPDGPSFRDALDAINPLNQIPIVSDILASVTGHEPSTGSKLAGGIIGAAVMGPITFVASLASVIFEDGAGKSPASAVYAALTGETGDSAVEVASAKGTMELAQADTYVEPVNATQLASLAPAAADDGAYETVKQDVMKAVASSNKGDAVLDLYGNSTASAHASYRKAQLLPYLRDVNHTRVM